VRTARVDRRVDDLVARIRPGEIAVIDVVDLDRTTAEALVAVGVSAVVNAAPSCSGRFAVRGPRTLLDAGVLLVDGVGSDVFARVRDGDTIRLDGGTVYAGGDRVVVGSLQSDASVDASSVAAGLGLRARLGTLVADAARVLDDDAGRILEGDGFPPLSTRWRDRIVVVVTAGSTPEELRTVRALVRRRGAVLVAVGAGADRALAARIRPHLTVVGRAGISEHALARAREVLVLDGADVVAPVPTGIPRAGAVSLGSPEDTAVLLAHTRGASFVVTCGLDESLAGVIDRSAAAGSMPLLGRIRGGGRHASADGLQALRERRGAVVPVAIVSVAAVLGVAAGAVVGVGPLQSLRDRTSNASDTSQARADQDVAELAAFQSAVTPALVGGTLADHSVAVLTLPGAGDPAAVVETLRAAGADLSGPLALDADYLDPARARVLRDLALQIAAPPVKAAVAALPAGTGVERQLDTALAASLATRSPAAIGRTDTARGTLLTALAKVGALEAPTGPMNGADLVVLIVPASADAAGAARGADLARALVAAGRGVVVLTDAQPSVPTGGAVGALRAPSPTPPASGPSPTPAASGPALSTVDMLGRPAGPVASVLALAALLRGSGAGDYGLAADAEALVPQVGATPKGTGSQP
jgi:uncharacterized membrane-anchored protein